MNTSKKKHTVSNNTIIRSFKFPRDLDARITATAAENTRTRSAEVFHMLKFALAHGYDSHTAAGRETVHLSAQ